MMMIMMMVPVPYWLRSERKYDKNIGCIRCTHELHVLILINFSHSMRPSAMSAASPQLRVLRGPKHGAVAEHHETKYQ